MSIYNDFSHGKYRSSDGNWYTTPWEAEAASNRYNKQKELVEQQRKANDIAKESAKRQAQLQEEANRLEQQKLQNQKEMQERQLQHEADMREKDRQAEKDNILAQYALMELEEARKQKERKIQLCDEHDIDYNDIQGFIQYLNTPEEDTLHKVEELYTKRDNYEKQRQRKQEIKDEIHKFESLMETYKNPRNTIKPITSTQLGCYLIIFFAIVFGIPGIFMAATDNPMPLIIVDLILCGIVYLIGKSTQMKEIHKISRDNSKKVEELKQRIKEFKNALIQENIPNDILNLVLNTDKEIRNMEQEVDKDVTNKRNKFNEFRKTHYNDEMEKLLRKLEIEGLETIREKDATKKGTKKDYIRYIEQYL